MYYELLLVLKNILKVYKILMRSMDEVKYRWHRYVFLFLQLYIDVVLLIIDHTCIETVGVIYITI